MSIATVTTPSGFRSPDVDREVNDDEPPATTVLQTIEASLRKHPGPWIGAAVAAGMVVGWLVKRR